MMSSDFVLLRVVKRTDSYVVGCNTNTLPQNKKKMLASNLSHR
jgi:hypothetical protein